MKNDWFTLDSSNLLYSEIACFYIYKRPRSNKRLRILLKGGEQLIVSNGVMSVYNKLMKKFGLS